MVDKHSALFLADLIARFEEKDYEYLQGADTIIPKLKASLADLKEAQDFDFREIGDHLYDGVYIADGQGKTLYVNQAYERITGLRAEDVLNKSVTDCEKEGLYRNAVTPEVIKRKRQVNSMGESLISNIKMLISGNPIFDEGGNVKKVVVVDRDITALLGMREQIEASQRKMRAVEADKRKNKQEIEHLRKFHLNKNLIGSSLEIRQILRKIQQITNLDVTVLITGETGTGKEVVANEIYINSIRQHDAYIKVNCAAIPSSLLEAELFGYEKGAFTGASNTGRLGMFELADKGTLLLDEIGEMPLELQAKLLRVIQHKEVTRIGGTKPIKLDVRILAATNCELQELVKKGQFREDLYYRLNVFPIDIPPLRERAGDIDLLASHFLKRYNTKYGKLVAIDQSGMALLKQYPWPGNIRELQNIIERLVIISEVNCNVTATQIQSILKVDTYHSGQLSEELGLKQIVEMVEKQTIERALAKYGSTRKAAKILKVDQSTIVKKAQKLGIPL